MCFVFHSIRCRREPRDNSLPPAGLGSFVKPWLADRGAAWGLVPAPLRCPQGVWDGVFGVRHLELDTLPAWQPGSVRLPVSKTLWESSFT